MAAVSLNSKSFALLPPQLLGNCDAHVICRSRGCSVTDSVEFRFNN